jgi:hypothetical protein
VRQIYRERKREREREREREKARERAGKRERERGGRVSERRKNFERVRDILHTFIDVGQN